MKVIDTALCSYGMSGLVFHGPLLEQHPGFRIAMILERNKHSSKGKHPGARLVRNYQAILNDPDIRLVVVNTPDHLHYDMARAALLAGKDVVVEKPFTLKTTHALELTELARKKGCLISVFQNRRWDGDFLTVKDILDRGLLGTLVDFESHFDRYRTEIKPSWKDQASGTGTLYNLGSHLIDQALCLFGKPEYLYCDSRMLRVGARTDDSFDLLLHYPGFKCQLRSSYLVRLPGPRFILHGLDGSYLKWGTDPQEEALKQGLLPGSEHWGEEDQADWGSMHSGQGEDQRSGPYPSLAGNYMAYYDNVHAALTRGADLEVKPEQAMEVIRLVEAAYESSREKTVIKL